MHWEIEALDPDKLRTFYAELFNWTIGDGPIMDIAPGFGGPEPGPAGHLRRSNRSGVTLYIQVADLRTSIDKATELGGTALMDEPFDVPGGPTIAAIADPEGNTVMLVQQ